MIFNQTLPAQGGGNGTWTLTIVNNDNADISIWDASNGYSSEVAEGTFEALAGSVIVVQSYNGETPIVKDASTDEDRTGDLVTQIDERTYVVICDASISGGQLTVEPYV